jgi:hypothetical protein
MRRTVPLPIEWLDYLKRQPETGMGYQVVSLTLKDGRHFDHVLIADGQITQIRDWEEIPFTAQDEIKSMKVTHKKWKFKK